MASKAATDAAFRPMTLEEWRAYTGTEHLGATLPYTDLGSPNRLDPAQKCPHGQYSAAYCVLCGDLQYDRHCRVSSETPIERKEIVCERCGAKGKDKCDCKPERRYKFVGEDEWGANFEIRPNADRTPVLFQAQMLRPQFPAGRPWEAEYTENHYKIAFLYRVHFPISWRSLLPFRLVQQHSKCTKPKNCKHPVSHGHPTIENVHATKLRAGFGSLVENPVVPNIRKPAITRNEMETRWYREMQFQPFEPWLERVYALHRIRVNQRWLTLDPFPRRIEPPYLKEWAAEYWMRPTVTILNRQVPLPQLWSGPHITREKCCPFTLRPDAPGWMVTYRVGSRPKAGKPMNLSKRSMMKITVRLKVKDAAVLWNVSERTARRRLAEMRGKPYQAVESFALK